MMVDFNKQNTETLLKENGRTLKDVSYDYEYHQGKYDVLYLNKIGINLGLGSKSKHIAFIDTTSEVSNDFLKKLGCKYLIGKKENDEDLIDQGFIFDGLWKKFIDDYLIKIETKHNQTTFVGIDNLKVLRENSKYISVWKKAEKQQNVDGAENIIKVLAGTWVFSLDQSKKVSKTELTIPFGDDRIFDFRSNGESIWYNLRKITPYLEELFEKVKSVSETEKNKLLSFTHTFDLWELKSHSDSIRVIEGKFNYKNYFRITKIFKNGSFNLKLFENGRITNYKMRLTDNQLYVEDSRYTRVYNRAEKTKIKFS